jgi:hypothetical protein
MSISPIELQGSDPLSNRVVEKENPSSSHGDAQISPPGCGGSSPQSGDSIADSPTSGVHFVLLPTLFSLISGFLYR